MEASADSYGYVPLDLESATADNTVEKPAVSYSARIISASVVLANSVMTNPACDLNNYDTQCYNEAARQCDGGHFQNAIRILTELIKRQPNNPRILVELGHAHMNNADDLTHSTEYAGKCFRKAIELDPEYGRAYKKLCEWYSAHGDWQNAVKYATKALSVKKPDNGALNERACAYSNLHKDKEALADFDAFLHNINLPKSGRYTWKIQLQRAGLLENMKEYDKALAVYRLLLKDNYEDQIVFREVACLRAMHKPDEALKCLNNLIAHNKADDTGYLNRARLYESLGRHKEAVTDYSTAIDLSPSTTYYRERASVYDKMGRKDLGDKDRKEADRL